MRQNVEGKFLTAVQAAGVLQLDPDTVRLLAREGKLPGAKVGRQWRFDLGLLREWMRERSLAGRVRTSRRPTGSVHAAKKRNPQGPR